MADTKASRVFLIIALILGVLATVMAFAYIDRTATESGGGDKSVILVAARDLRPNTPLEPDKDFKPVEVPRLFRNFSQLVLTPAVKEAYKGQRLNRRVLAGQPVMLADLSTSAELTVSKGKFALSIPAKGAMGVSNLVVPGDYVKVLITQSTATAGGVAVETIAAGKDETGATASYRILAVGNQLSRNRSRVTAAEMYDTSLDNESQQTVTIEVTEDQAREIVAKSNAYRSPITLLLSAPPQAFENTPETRPN